MRLARETRHATLLYLSKSNARILIVRVSFFESRLSLPFWDELVLKQLDFIQLTLPETRLHKFL